MPLIQTQTINTLSGTPSPSYSWHEYMAPVKDQGETPTCYGQSIISIYEALYNKAFPEEGQNKSFTVTRTIADWAYYWSVLKVGYDVSNHVDEVK